MGTRDRIPGNGHQCDIARIIAEASINNRVITLTFAVVMLVGGIKAFNGLSRLEDPEFTIKDALVITPYPGASAAEVEEEVTDHIEIAVQQLGQLDEIESRSTRGMSNLTVSIKKQYDSAALPQVWDELRRKVGDAQSGLPPGAGPSIVVDDFGDVYGVFVAIYGEEYSYAELKDVVDLLRRELLLVQDVAKIDTYGEFVEAIYVELERDRMAELGIPSSAIIRELKNKNIATDGRPREGRRGIHLDRSHGRTRLGRRFRIRSDQPRRNEADLPQGCRKSLAGLRRATRKFDALRRKGRDRPRHLDRSRRATSSPWARRSGSE